MRPIKFRAWNTTIKKMGMVKTLNLVGRMSEIDFGLENPDEGWRRLARAVFGAKHSETTFMQFTGIKDKNGKDIYESDLVYWKQSPGGLLPADENYYVCQIIWGDSAWECKHLTSESKFTFSGNHMEVIGNIYENKELL